jgi:mono/diheme cytochrome c family protein
MPAGLLTSQEAQERGSAIFAANCSLCHGAGGDGYGQRREGMNPPAANLTLLDWSERTGANHVFEVIRNGIPGTAMPSWPMLSDQQVWEVVAHLHSLRSR